MKMQEAERGRRLRKEPIYPCSLGSKRPHRFLGVIEKCIQVPSKANPILDNIYSAKHANRSHPSRYSATGDLYLGVVIKSNQRTTVG